MKGISKEDFIAKVDGDIFKKYDVIKELGSGGYARCLLVKNKTTGNLYACKEMQKNKLNDMAGFTREINIMTKLDHPNIIKLYEVYQTEMYIYLVMELCQGGELFDRIIANTEAEKAFTEKQAAEIFRQMMSAINYCHKNKIVHRDLKPENLLCLTKDENSPIKVIDFGMSKIFHSKENMSERVGTAYYISPEVIKGVYDEKCDIWSAGVILYVLLCGYPPFNGDDDDDIMRNVLKKQFIFPSPEWDNVSEGAKNIIKRMLTDPDKRPTAEETLKDPWIEKCAPGEKGAVKINSKAMKRYASACKLKKAVLIYMASRLTDNEIENLKKNFQSIDKNGDGMLSLTELKEAVNDTDGLPLSNVEEVFMTLDTDKNGKISYTEFIAASMEKNIFLNEAKLKEAFKLFDIDNSGKISRDEIISLLGGDKSSKELDKLFDKYDSNKDGEIDFEEFIHMMKKRPKNL